MSLSLPQTYIDAYKTVAVLEFDRDRKSMSVIVRPAGAAANTLLVKGAAECILERSTRCVCSLQFLTAPCCLPINLTLNRNYENQLFKSHFALLTAHL